MQSQSLGFSGCQIVALATATVRVHNRLIYKHFRDLRRGKPISASGKDLIGMPLRSSTLSYHETICQVDWIMEFSAIIRRANLLNCVTYWYKKYVRGKTTSGINVARTLGNEDRPLIKHRNQIVVVASVKILRKRRSGWHLFRFLKTKDSPQRRL